MGEVDARDITAVRYEDSECELQLEPWGHKLQVSPSSSAVTARNLKQSALRERNLLSPSRPFTLTGGGKDLVLLRIPGRII